MCSVLNWLINIVEAAGRAAWLHDEGSEACFISYDDVDAEV